MQSYPGPGGKFPVSSDGGTMPRWVRSGRELLYTNGDRMMAVDVELSPAFRPSKPRVLFEGHYQVGYGCGSGWPLPDGQTPRRYVAAAGWSYIVVNWDEELRRRVPLGK